MNVDRQFQVFAVFAVLFVGTIAGGALVFDQMDSRIDNLQQRLEKAETGEKVVYLNYSREDSLTHLFEKTDQSVVSVSAVGNQSAQGSGFVYSKNGFIVTNQHVVEGAKRVEVTFIDGSTYNAEIVGTDLYTDLAVLKVSRSDLEPVELGNSSQVQVGQRAVAIGNPFGLRGSMTSGIISQKGRLIPVAGGFSIPNVLQTDAAVNPGNSGGPLLNIKGEVIGVNTAIETTTGSFSGIGFAIPVNTVKNVVPEIIENGNYKHPWIGVSGLDVGPTIAEKRGLETATGFLVVSVVEDGPADQAGITSGNKTVTIDGQKVNIGGDVITAINGEKVRGITDILLYLSRDTSVGDKVNLTVLRYENGENRKMNITVELGSRAERRELVN